LKEWALYLRIFGQKPLIRELHIGGGTPTFFSPENLRWLITYLLEESNVHDDNEFSFEGHPNNTSAQHLTTLAGLGFRRVSFGVQDLDATVQKAINRVQPFENLARVTNWSRMAGYESISFDLIYGLPFQTTDSIENTVNQVLTLRPDRISFYSYAHVPWVSPGQRGYRETDLPSDIQKRNLYETGRSLLTKNGYEEIGMDHFALPHDSLYRAQQHGRLHRNFMGYTTTNTDLLVGLGASGISDAKYAYAQNLKKVEDYSRVIMEDGLAILKGHLLSDEDLRLKKIILEISCSGEIRREALATVHDPSILDRLHIMEREGILKVSDHGFHVTGLGKPFIRNVCSIFDQKLKAENTGDACRNIFSRSI
jgi:oxygen-independent coproporphyrinogen-3 oxidase